MSLSAEEMRMLAEAGLKTEQLVLVAELIEKRSEKYESVKRAARDRKRKQRVTNTETSRDGHGTVTGQGRDCHTQKVSPPPVPPHTPPLTPTPAQATQNAGAYTCEGKSPFQMVYEEGVKNFPGLAAVNSSAIHAWITDGCDVDLDILPEIRRQSGKDIRAWSYFTGGITSAKATRLTPLPQGNANVRRYENQPSKAERAFNAIQLGLSQPTASTGGKP